MSPDTRSPAPSRARSESRGRSPTPARSRSRRSYSRDSRSPRRSDSRSRSPRSRRSDSPGGRRNGRRSYTPDSRASSRYRSGSDRSRGRRRSYSRTPSRRSSSPAPRVTKIIVDGLSRNVKEAHLLEIFGKYGPIKEIKVPLHPVFSLNRGIAYILYDEYDDAKNAWVKMDKAQLDGEVLKVQLVSTRRAFSVSPPRARGPPRRHDRGPYDRPRGGGAPGDYRPPPMGGPGGPSRRYRSPPRYARDRSPARGYGGRGDRGDRGGRGRGGGGFYRGRDGPRSRSRSPRRRRSSSYSSRSPSRSPRRGGGARGGGGGGYRRRDSPPRGRGGGGGLGRRSPSYDSYERSSDDSRRDGRGRR